MDEKTMRQIMFKSVSDTCDELTDQELAALNIVAQFGDSPFFRIFDYEKVKALFTVGDGTQMHSETKQALSAVTKARLQGGEG